MLSNKTFALRTQAMHLHERSTDDAAYRAAKAAHRSERVAIARRIVESRRADRGQR